MSEDLAAGARRLRDAPRPEWTGRPNAKDHPRAMAVHLRQEGWSVPDIAVELGVARSTAFRWTAHVPLGLDAKTVRTQRARSKLMTDARWGKYREERDQRRATVTDAAGAMVGALDRRDLLLLGAAVYWCEGRKAKPWRPNDAGITFTNSDPWLLELFLRFLEASGIDRGQSTYRVSIHESADAAAAAEWWAKRLRLPSERFQRPTLKRHVPQTNRRNTGADYHGCLVVRVPRSRELYWQVEGIMRALAE